MNLRDLKYIVSVAKEANFARAAKKSFVSQPTLSMQIKKLEDELGIKIFERSKKKFLITKIGAEILKKAEIILHEESEIKNLAKNSIDPYSGELFIAAFPTLAPYFFPDFVKKISKKFPKLKLLLVEEKTETLIKKLKNGEIDAAFLALPIIEKEFESIKIFEEEFLLAVSSKHEFAKRKIINQSELKGKELMLLEEGHCLREQALEACSMIGTFEAQTFRATSLETLRQMIIANSGITLIPQIAAIKNPKISYIKIEKAPKRVIAMFFRKNSFKKDLLKDVIELSK